jgi:hypothetical protein
VGKAFKELVGENAGKFNDLERKKHKKAYWFWLWQHKEFQEYFLQIHGEFSKIFFE